MESLVEKHWHFLPEREVLDLLEVEPDKGLDIFEVDERLEIYGPNMTTAKNEKGYLLRFLLQFRQPLILILISAATITLLFQEWIDAAVIYGVVLINAIVGFVQELKAGKAIEALSRTMTTEALVRRSGEQQRITAANIVPGDVVLLKTGDKVPADLRLLDSHNVQIDESALTGESLPVAKNPESLEHDTILADRSNMAYSSTLVTHGNGLGIAVSTGDNTEVGRISQLISAVEELETPLTRKIAYFSRILLYAILLLAIVTFGAGLIRGESAFEMFMATVALAVGAIPEGLPAAITITLAIGVNRMARRRAIIRKLPAVETLGSTTVICSDKTGTLTENQMTVRSILAGDKLFEVTGDGYAPEGQVLHKESPVDISEFTALRECLLAGLLCNDSLLMKAEGRWKIEGDPTEGALLVSAEKGDLSSDIMKNKLPRLDAIPFKSEHQYMATFHDMEPGHPRIVYMKGAAEAVLEKCANYLDSAGRAAELDISHSQRALEEMASNGLRVLAFARKELGRETHRLHHSDVESGLTYLGLQGMIDPPRQEAISAVRNCHTAGIRVKMITGDHALTASAIAQMIGLHNSDDVVSGKSLAGIPDSELITLVDETSVFARMAPEQKLRLVEALQANENVVAMTGDGVNDAPALKKADIGVAMGISGTEVAKEAADMVLTDDNFATIEAAVEEGRNVFDNLTKFIAWTLPTNLGEGLVIVLAILAGITLPILPLQILWINMTTAVLLGLTLAFEPKEPGIMTRLPRDPKAPILTRALLERMFLVGTMLLIGAFVFFEWELSIDASIEEARTAAVNLFVMVELFYLFNCRSLTKSIWRLGLFSNPWIYLGVTIMLVLQLLYTYLPAMNLIFQSVPISLTAWMRLLAFAITVFFVVDFEKWLRSK